MVTMPKLRRALLLSSAIALTAGGLVAVVTATPSAATPFNVKHLNKIQRRLVSSELLGSLGGTNITPNVTPGGGDPDAGGGVDGAPDTPPADFTYAGSANSQPGTFNPSHTGTCSSRRDGNVKVNQNCLTVSDPDLQGRGQANNETFIAQDRFDPDHLVASDN